MPSIKASTIAKHNSTASNALAKLISAAREAAPTTSVEEWNDFVDTQVKTALTRAYEIANRS